MTADGSDNAIMNDAGVLKAIEALKDALNAAHSKRHFEPVTEIAVVCMTHDKKSAFYSGCPCMICKVQLMAYLGRSLGAEIGTVDLSAAIDAARAVH